jgi:hypothetical protein
MLATSCIMNPHLLNQFFQVTVKKTGTYFVCIFLATLPVTIQDLSESFTGIRTGGFLSVYFQ